MGKTNLVWVHDLVEKNGKTIKENNLEKEHTIPIGSLVEVQYDHWHGDGACEKVHARMWVHSHDRDCDGTPLYSLSRNKVTLYENASIFIGKVKVRERIAHAMLNKLESGFSEGRLKVIEVTNDIINGVGSLTWDEE